MNNDERVDNKLLCFNNIEEMRLVIIAIRMWLRFMLHNYLVNVVNYRIDIIHLVAMYVIDIYLIHHGYEHRCIDVNQQYYQCDQPTHKTA